MPNVKIVTLLFFLASFASSFAMAELGWNRYPPGVSGLDGKICLLYTSPSPRDQRGTRMPSSA